MTLPEEQEILAQIASLETTKAKIRAAINKKSVQVGQDSPFASYADAIDKINTTTGGKFGIADRVYELPPEGNYGGGVNKSLAWKRGECATLITPSEDAEHLSEDHPNEATFHVWDQDDFDTWVFDDNGNDEANFAVVCIHPLPEGAHYVLKHSVSFNVVNTNKVFAENGVIIDWDWKISTNVAPTATTPSQSPQSQYAFMRNTPATTDACYVQNVVFNMKYSASDSYLSKATQNIYFVRGCEVWVDASSYGSNLAMLTQPFSAYGKISRVFAETEAVSPSSGTSNANARVFEANGTMSDVTISVLQKSTNHAAVNQAGPLVGFYAPNNAAVTMTRCYALGLYRYCGIDLGTAQASKVDRCYVERVVLRTDTIAGTHTDAYGIRAGTIERSYVEEFFTYDSENGTTLAAASNARAMYAYVKIDKSKVRTAALGAKSGVFSAPTISESAAVNVFAVGTFRSASGTGGDVNSASVFEAQGNSALIEKNVIYDVNSAEILYGAYLYLFKGTNTTTSVCKNNVVGHVKVSNSQLSGTPGQLVVFYNWGTVDSNVVGDMNVYSFGTYEFFYIGNVVKNFTKNKVFSYNASIGTANLYPIYLSTVTDSTFDENKIGDVVLSTAPNSTYYLVNNNVIHCPNVLSFKKNQIGSVKVNTGYNLVHLVTTQRADVEVLDNVVGSFTVEYALIHSSVKTVSCFHHTTQNGFNISNNTVYNMAVTIQANSATNVWNNHLVYGIFVESGSNGNITNNYIGKLVGRLSNGQTTAFPFPGMTTLYGATLQVYGIYFPNSSTRIAHNNVGVFSDFTAYGIYNVAISGTLPAEMNEENTVYVETYSNNESFTTNSIKCYDAIGFYQVKNLVKSHVRPGHTVKTMYQTCYSGPATEDILADIAENENPVSVKFRV